MKSNIILLLFLILQIFTLSISSSKYSLTFEYLLSDEKDKFEIELFNKPKNNPIDNDEDIFYSGKIEQIEKYPTSKLVDFNATEFEKKIRRKNMPIYEGFSNLFNDVEKDDKKTEEKYEKKEVKTPETKEKEEKKQSPYRTIYEDPFARIFSNDYSPYNPFQNIITYQRNNRKQNQENKYNNNNDNYYTKYDQNKNDKQQKNNNYNFFNHNQNKFNGPLNIQIIHQVNDQNGRPTFRIIKYPINNNYKTTYHLNDNNGKSYSKINSNNYKTNQNINNNNNKYDNEYDPFSAFDDFGFDPFKLLESKLNKIYGFRFLSENIKNKKMKSSLFSVNKYSLLYISNKFYFDYIKYLPKNTIILVPNIYAKDLQNYEDYYVFVVKENAFLNFAISKTENRNYIVKLGQNFNDSYLISIPISITVIICLIASIFYAYLLKNSFAEDILPIHNLAGKIPQVLCLLNIIIYFSYICSNYDSDGYYVITKYISLFLFALFRSVFLSILILLLNGWMTLSFIGWADRLNKIVPILIFEIASSMCFEILGFYDSIPYNKLQLYYFRNILENIIIFSIALVSLYKYYFPLIQKCKYLSIINSDFLDAYKLKQRKMLLFVVFALFYSFISIYSNYFEFDLTYKYIQNDSLHLVKQIIMESIFNFIFITILLPMELPYLFTEETDLVSFGYFFTDLHNEKSILDINDKNIKEIKNNVEENEDIPIIVVNPFYTSQDGFDDLYAGKVIIEK